MHRALGYLSKRFVQVRAGEGRKVTLTFLYFFLIISAYYLIKPVSRSLVLGELGSRMVPYIDLICALVMGPVVTLFARLVDRVRKPQLVSGSFLGIIGLLLVFWRLLSLPAAWIAGAFYVWVSIFSVLVVTLFWLVANDLYRPREAKRLFGFIGSGGILGGIAGSSLAAVGAHVIGTENLLLLSAALLLGCWVVVGQLWALAPDRAEAEEACPVAARRETFLSNVRDFIRTLLQSRYLLLLVVMVGLNKLVATLIYYQLNPFIEQAFPDVDARTSFTGMFLGTMNAISFSVQFFLTSWILRRWGLFVALIALPLGLLTGTSTLLFLPLFWVAVATELYDGSMNYSLQQTTKEVLYLPIDRAVRYKVKPFIDMVVFRFGKGVAAIIGIVLLDTLHMPAKYLSLVAVPLILGWLATAIQLRRDYILRIRTILQAHAAAKYRTAARLQPATRPAPEVPIELFGSLTNRPSSARKLALVDRLVAMQGPMPPTAKELLAELATYDSGPEGPAQDTDAKRLKRIITDQREPMAGRCQAVRQLARVAADQRTVDFLFGMELVEADAVLRQEALRQLVKLRLRDGKSLDFPTQAIRRQVAREVENFQQVIYVTEVYRQHHPGPLAADDPLFGLLRVLTEESIEQIFRLLMLIYRPDDVHLVYEQIREPEAHIRADAVELLDNLVDSGMRVVLAPILDEDRFLAVLEEGTGIVYEPEVAQRLLQGAIWDHNSWLCVTTLCAVGRLRLTAMREDLERAARHTVPLVSKAARVALHLAALS